MRKTLQFLSLALLLSVAAGAEKRYTDAYSAHIGPQAWARLRNIKRAGVSEILVPTWFPADLRMARIKTAENKAGRFGPSLDIVWPAHQAHRSLTLRGGSGGFGGPGPNSTEVVVNPSYGKILMGISGPDNPLPTYGTDWLPIAGSMPKAPSYQKYHVGVDTAGNHRDTLTRNEMRRILKSLRYLRL